MKFKNFDEKKFNRIVNEVPSGNYRIFNPEEPLIKDLKPHLSLPFNSVCMGTGMTGDISIHYASEIIPPRSPIILERVLRYCTHNGEPHLNADDLVYFPTVSGAIKRGYRSDAPDHYQRIIDFTGLDTIANAYHLPKNTQGAISEYVENGAFVPIRIASDQKDKFVKMKNITKRNGNSTQEK